MTPTVSISADQNQPAGFSILTVSGIPSDVDRLYYSVSREDNTLKYVGEQTWQRVFEWLEPSEASYGEEQFQFVLPPAITAQMAPQAYVLALKVYPTAEEFFIDFTWPKELPKGELIRPVIEQSLPEPEKVTQEENDDFYSESPFAPLAEETKPDTPASSEPKPIQNKPNVVKLEIPKPAVSNTSPKNQEHKQQAPKQPTPVAKSKPAVASESPIATDTSRTRQSIGLGKALIISLLFLALFSGAIYLAISSLSSTSVETEILATPESHLEEKIELPVHPTPQVESPAEPLMTPTTEIENVKEEAELEIPIADIQPPVAEIPETEQTPQSEPDTDDTVDQLKALLSEEGNQQQNENNIQSIEPALRETLSE